jgi:hypothetical protein
MHQAEKAGSVQDSRNSPRIDPVPPDRRNTPRHTVLEHRAWLGWWNADDFKVADVHLLKLGRGGAAIEIEELLAERQKAILGLGVLREAWCLDVTVVGNTRGRREKHRVHVAFSEPCNDIFYATALHGPGRVDAVGTSPGPTD